MKTILATVLTILLLLPGSALGEIQTIIHTVKQPFGGSQSPDDARIAAVAKAKREALELAGTYIESTTVVKNAQVEKDEILALTAGVLKAEVVSQKNYTTDDAFGIEVKVRVEVDTALLEARLKKVMEDRTHFEQLKQARSREKELLKKVAVLEEKNRKSGKSKQKSTDLKKEFQAASRGLTAGELLQKSLDLWIDGKLSDPRKSIEYMNEFIRLEPDFAMAYYVRGDAYADLGEHQQAIRDYDQAIRMKIGDVGVYNDRAVSYFRSGQHEKAMQDFDKAIRLKPEIEVVAKVYFNRGFFYAELDQFQRAIGDYNEAIRLKPDFAHAYGNRGIAYVYLEQYQRAIPDLDEAIRLEPDSPDNAEIFSTRGFAYAHMGQHQQAFRDLDEAIRLKPNSADVYAIQGRAYLITDNRSEGCQSIIKACELGKCESYELVKGYCQSEWMNRINAMNDKEDWQGALECCRKWTIIEPQNVKAWYNLGYFYRKIKGYDDAIKAFRQAIRINPEEAGSWFSLGLTYTYELKRYDDAIEAYRQAIRINPNEAMFLFQLAIVHGKLKRYDDAIEANRQAIRINPGLTLAWNDLAINYLLTGNRSAALDAVRGLRRLDPAMADTLLNMITPQ
jgi:tetratricopeptide (TPR) repeat protein